MTQANRGKALETLIDHTNKIYKQKGQALIDKVPTPWSVSYNRRTGRVSRAFPQKKGTVDFVGISHGRSIAFDAKNTNSRTSFPLSNVADHQLEYLLNHQDQGGISFIIVCFAKHQEHYLLRVNDLKTWWDGSLKGERKSIPYNWFVENCDLIKSSNGIPLDYLKKCV